MIYLVLDVQSTAHIGESGQLNAWVNVKSHNEAMAILSEELSLQGWVATNIIESAKTDESDYFPPCQSYDAYKEASQGMLALRFSS